MFFSKDLTMGQMNALAQLFGDEQDVLDALRGKFKIERIEPRFVITIDNVTSLRKLAKKCGVVHSGIIHGDYDREFEPGSWECEVVNDPSIESTGSFSELRSCATLEEHGWVPANPEHVLAFAGAYPKVVKNLGGILYALGDPVSNDDFLSVHYEGTGENGSGPKRIQAMTFDEDFGVSQKARALRVRRMK